MKFQNPTTGQTVETKDKGEIKRMKTCGWKQIKTPKLTFVKGLKEGKNFFN